MGSSEIKPPSSASGSIRIVAGVVFLTATALHLLLVVGPHLVYFQQGPVFLTTMDFLKRTVVRPGGLAEYASLFLTQWCLYPWVGALAMTASAGMVCLATWFVLVPVTGGRVSWVFAWLPALVLVMLYSRYDYHLTHGLALSGALVGAGVYARVRWRGFAARLALFAALGAAAYLACGGMVALFGVLCGIYEIGHRRRIVLGGVCVLVSASVPGVVAAWSYALRAVDAYEPLWPYALMNFTRPSLVPTLLPRGYPRPSLEPRFVLELTLAALPVVLMILTMFRGRIARLLRLLRRLLRLGGRRRAPDGAEGRTHPLAVLWSAVSIVVFVALGWVLTVWSLDADERTRLGIGCDVDRGAWAQALAKAGTLAPEHYDAMIMHDVNRALFHTGRLPYDMFRFPQKRIVAGIKFRLTDGLFLYTHRVRNLHQACLKSSALLYELGQLNLADKETQVAREIFGDRPALMKRMVSICLIKRKPSLARTYLRRLRRNPLYARWAQDVLDRLRDDAMPAEFAHPHPAVIRRDLNWRGLELFLDTNAEIQVPPGAQRPEDNTNETVLLQLLQADPTNRMAFEYLMAHYLLRRRPDKVYENLRRLDDFDYPPGVIPRHYEEAAWVYMMKKGIRPPDFHGRRPSVAVAEELQGWRTSFRTWHQSTGEAKAAAEKELERMYGHTYFFYDALGYSVRRTKPSLVDAVTGASAWQRDRF